MQQQRQDIPKQLKDVQKSLKRLQQQSASARSVWGLGIYQGAIIYYVPQAYVFVDSISFLLYSIYSVFVCIFIHCISMSVFLHAYITFTVHNILCYMLYSISYVP